jgi:hypothetical protein
MKTNLTQLQLDQLAELISFNEDANGLLTIQDVKGSVKGRVEGHVGGHVLGSVKGSVWGDVKGSVKGHVLGNVWREKT